MKKNVYQSPKMETVKMAYSKFLCGSEIAGGGGIGFSREADVEE